MASSSDSLHPRLENDTFSVSMEFMIKVKDAVEQWVTISISWVYTFYTQTYSTPCLEHSYKYFASNSPITSSSPAH